MALYTVFTVTETFYYRSTCFMSHGAVSQSEIRLNRSPQWACNNLQISAIIVPFRKFKDSLLPYKVSRS